MPGGNAQITALDDGIFAVDTEYSRPMQDASHLLVEDGRAAFGERAALALPVDGPAAALVADVVRVAARHVDALRVLRAVLSWPRRWCPAAFRVCG